MNCSAPPPTACLVLLIVSDAMRGPGTETETTADMMAAQRRAAVGATYTGQADTGARERRETESGRKSGLEAKLTLTALRCRDEGMRTRMSM